MLKEATFAQLPPSIMREHTLPWIVHLVWNMFSLYSSKSPFWLLKGLFNTSNSPSSASSTTSSCSSMNYTSFSSSSSTSLHASHLAKEVILLLGHYEAMRPSPWHLKHLLLFVGGELASLEGVSSLEGLGTFVGWRE